MQAHRQQEEQRANQGNALHISLFLVFPQIYKEFRTQAQRPARFLAAIWENAGERLKDFVKQY